MQFTSFISNDGQITIPKSIRKAVRWLSPTSPVSVIVSNSDLFISPKREVDWDKLWKQIKKVRAYQGKGQGNLSAAIAEDRQSRR